MRKIKTITVSHAYKPKFEHLVAHREQCGWKIINTVTEHDGRYFVDMAIEQRPIIYTSISGILYPNNDKSQSEAVDAYRAGKFTDIQFISTAVQNLISLLDLAEAKLKVHSMWRYRIYGETQQMTQLFLNNGFEPHHLHPQFFVPFKGRDGSKELDISFSLSDDSLVNIVLDSLCLELPSQFVSHKVQSPSKRLSSRDIDAIRELIDREVL
ncbi:hypothetical protein [Vibrio parahaemolyticus]|uniref:hypothetical protein n=1 Tax=Vibrio parahaemolyticus TaxID=670 RepID=UPI00084A58B4|nr:hypothetical protein [Vibrio parahaemolyticus]EGQ9274384.1 hypothetical protein [Vibrio parahaemolyticus]EGQ9709954.1 hypothetical protein [Vibrio parahaemolyticus]EGQ9799226.1 hypothetical protein [Vibrio parahaemolyticus]EIA0900489.1 hypothetical protein [Vibrio parahaemolyticus]EID0732120.1 hypothetical protein [Vibrio parahaemolyticus]